ncbi:MAG: NAD-binding protein [Campylobacterota bacterium]|nr:NAD-binding protein [Campylobacterota bacterium]
MNKKIALIFGNNEYSQEIAKNITTIYSDIHIFTLDDKDDENSFDLSDDWNELQSKYDMQNCISFCTLENMAENIFLTISLRDSFKDLHIVALAKDKESSHKLELAGASRVIPLIQTISNIIVEMLEKPVVTQILHNILYEKSDLQIAQIKINSYDDIELARKYNILVLFIVRKDMSKEFIYSSKAKHHEVDDGDSFIVVGLAEDIIEFEKKVGVKNV